MPDYEKPSQPGAGAEQEREIEYLVCRLCNTPCYTFEMDRGRLTEAICMMCGNDDILLFQMTEDEEE